MTRIAPGTITKLILEEGSLRAAWDSIQKLDLHPAARKALEEVLDADSKMMGLRSKERRFEVQRPEVHAKVVLIAAKGGTVQKVYDAVKQELGDDAPSKATVHRIMVQQRTKSVFKEATESIKKVLSSGSGE